MPMAQIHVIANTIVTARATTTGRWAASASSPSRSKVYFAATSA